MAGQQNPQKLGGLFSSMSGPGVQTFAYSSGGPGSSVSTMMGGGGDVVGQNLTGTAGGGAIDTLFTHGSRAVHELPSGSSEDVRLDKDIRIQSGVNPSVAPGTQSTLEDVGGGGGVPSGTAVSREGQRLGAGRLDDMSRPGVGQGM